MGETDTLRVAISHAFPSDIPYGVFVWEIERGQKVLSDSPSQSLEFLVEKLHDEVRAVFDTAVGPNLSSLLKENKQ